MSEMSDDKITQDEMVRMFGTHMPIEAVNLAFDSPGDMTIRELRAKLREIAAVRAERVLVEVTPADRFAAAEAGQSFARWTPGQVAKTMRGDGDECGMVQAFARHRHDSLTTMQDREATLIRVLRKIKDATDADDPDSYRCDDREGCLDAVYNLAIEALGTSGLVEP